MLCSLRPGFYVSRGGNIQRVNDHENTSRQGSEAEMSVKVKVKVWVVATALPILKPSSALQSQKWQLTGMS